MAKKSDMDMSVELQTRGGEGPLPMTVSLEVSKGMKGAYGWVAKVSNATSVDECIAQMDDLIRKIQDHLPQTSITLEG